MDVNSAEERTGDLFLVFGHKGRRTRTGFLRVTVVAAWAVVYAIGIMFYYVSWVCNYSKPSSDSNDTIRQ